ncbi:MAG: hypothetical protein JNL73_12455 [Anaerolineales bacterium]|nr:hypothetical protein [Anaerolineales bacterium]
MPARPFAFDPECVARFEMENYQAYYRRRWGQLARATIGLMRAAFGFNRLDAVYAAYLVARAELAFAPFPHNDSPRAEAYMRRFYGLLKARHGVAIDVDQAARLDVRWWQVHRDHFASDDLGPLTEALVEWMAAVYRLDRERLRATARLRAYGIWCSDRWVRAGLPDHSPWLAQEARALTQSYRALRDAIRPPSVVEPLSFPEPHEPAPAVAGGVPTSGGSAFLDVSGDERAHA